MKKQALIILSCLTLYSTSANAQHTQTDLYNSINNAFTWQSTNADALSSPGTAASDFYIMALSKMGADYDYGAYVRSTEPIVPSTKQDGQRLIMANAAAGEFLSNSFVGWYTYNAEFDNASDLAGAIITLKSGDFTVSNSNTDLDRMTSQLLTYQQSNGSFGNDVLSTAKAVMALSYFRNTEFEIQGENKNEFYSYNSETAIDSAIGYLSSSQKSDGGFSTVLNTAFSVIALDSVGVDSDDDSRFAKNSNTPISFLLSIQQPNGSFNGLAEDTAISSCALVSHLRFVQNKSNFFDFKSNDKINVPKKEEGASSSATHSNSLNATPTPKPTQKTVTVTPIPTREPEHSNIDTEEYGPFPFIGPLLSTDKPEGLISNTDNDTPSGGNKAVSVVLIALLGIAVFVAAAMFVILKKKPELLTKYQIFNMLPKKKTQPPKSSAENEEADLLSDIDSPGNIVSTEELYDPDFIKKLIPVDEIDNSIDSLIPKEDDTSDTEHDENKQ